MTLQEILNATWVSLLGFIFALGIGLNMIITKSASVLRGKNDHVIYKDEAQYATKGGYLMLVFAVGSLINAGLMLYSGIIALIEAAVFCIGVVILWKNVSIKYGPIR